MLFVLRFLNSYFSFKMISKPLPLRIHFCLLCFYLFCEPMLLLLLLRHSLSLSLLSLLMILLLQVQKRAQKVPSQKHDGKK